MTQQNVRGSYMNFTHDRAQDWDWLRKWEPNVIRLMMHGSHSDPASVDVNRIRRVHETCPDALILLRVWDVDDRNFEAHADMVADPQREATRQVDWWARAIDRVQGVPRNQLMAGLNNETGPEKDAALYLYTEHALTLGTQKGIRLGGLVFSTGRPSLAGESQYDMPYFERLAPLFLAGDHAMILHSYMQPEGMYAVWKDDQGNERKDFTYLINRHARWNMPGVKTIIGEWGLDGILYNRHPHPEFGNSGWRNFRDLWTPDRYADEYVECVRMADPSVIGICPFESDFADRKWASFDMLDAYGALLARKDQCVKTIGDTPPANGTPAFVRVRDGANLRLAPVSGEILAKLPYTTQVAVLATDRGPDGYQWNRVQYSDKTGFIRADLLGTDKPAPDGPVDPPPSGDNWGRSLAFVLAHEGGWADDPNDSGGATMKGITIGTYTKWREAHGQPKPSKDDLRAISDGEVEQIYREWYWLASSADKLPWPMCLAVMDLAVNGGVGRAQEAFAAVGHSNFLAHAAWRLDWYCRLDGFKHFGRAWTRRVADLMREASKA